ncbi:hypothetical protein GCM10011572_49490 [Pseudoduganella buxea]|uniref:IS1595 family transposase n=2 Tax=Pseudoduganella buxea TaxID=1949069 RepID=A0ABQ1LAY6_9BURK|nr:hypothetical protein GCM10011572_49490 [Pseudoduganella buxea]
MNVHMNKHKARSQDQHAGRDGERASTLAAGGSAPQGQAGVLPERQAKALQELFGRCTTLAQCLDVIDGRGATLRNCPHCGANRLYRHGFASGLQRFRCPSCRKTCNALTGTPLAHLRRRDRWRPFLESLIESLSVRDSATLVGIHRNTSFRWRHRFLAAGRHDGEDGGNGPGH